MRRMKGVSRLLALAAMCMCSIAQSAADQDYRELDYPELRSITPPKATRTTLSNGMQLLLLEDHQLPLVNLTARIKTGAIYDPPTKAGLAEIAGEVLRTGGTPSMTGDQIDEQLESMAASIESGMGTDYGWVSASALKGNFARTLQLLADLMMHPAYPEDKIELARIQLRSAISRRNDQPAQIATREFAKLIYGAESVYAREPEYATVNAVSREDLVAFHRRFYGPGQTIVALWGDFETDAMIKAIDNAFSSWKRIDGAATPPPAVDYQYVRTVNLVARPDLNQSNIVLGHIGGLRKDPDYAAIVLMNQILGGGFTGRLFKNVRSREGLAYNVYGAYGADHLYPGVFAVGCQTKSGSTVQAIKAMAEEIRKIRETPVSEEELKLAKESFMNSFVFNFASEAEVMGRLLAYQYYGYPEDFLMKLREQVEEVTAADVGRAADKHLHPDKVQILVVGNPGEFDQPLSTLGDVRTIDISVPAPGQ